MVEWNDFECFDLENIYVNLELVKGTCELPIGKGSTVYDIFHPESGNKRNIILGGPGMGKTTLCRKLAVDFALTNQNFTSTFPEIEFVIFVRCRDLEESLIDYLSELVLDDPSMKDSFLQYVGRCSEKVLFLIDGLDELPSGKHADLDKLLKERSFEKSLVMTTTRTEGLQDKGEHFRNSTMYRITGFNQCDSETFVRKYFSSQDVNMAQKFIDHLRKHAELRKMTVNPLSLLLLCLLWDDCKNTLPTNFTDLYKALLDCLMNRFIHKSGISCCKNVINRYLILSLGRLAYQNTKEGKIYFDYADLDNVWNTDKELVSMKDREVTMDNVIQLGLVSADRGTKKLSKSYRFQFIHLSLQEFLTALYVQYCMNNGHDHSRSPLKDLAWILDFRLRPWNYPLIPRFKYEKVIKHLIYILDKDKMGQFFHTTLNVTKMLYENSCDCEKLFGCFSEIQPSAPASISEFLMQYLPKFVSLSSDSPSELFRKCSSYLVSQSASLGRPSHWHTSHILIRTFYQQISDEIREVIASNVCQIRTVNVLLSGTSDPKRLTTAWQQSREIQTYSLLWSNG